VAVHSASIQDRDGAALVLDRRTRRLFPFIERLAMIRIMLRRLTKPCLST
jgi:hypothetical protein